MRLRAVAAGIAAVVWTSSIAAAEGPLGSSRLFLRAGGAGVDTSFAIQPPASSTVLREALVAGAAIGIGFLLDDTIEPGTGRGTFVDQAGEVIGSPYALAGGTVLLAAHAWMENDRRELGTAARLAAGLAATGATVALFKVSVQRERPDGSDNESFPSGHAALAMTAATILDRRCGGPVPWISYGAAALVAAARIFGDRHRFSDVMAGAVIGRFYGRLLTERR